MIRIPSFPKDGEAGESAAASNPVYGYHTNRIA